MTNRNNDRLPVNSTPSVWAPKYVQDAYDALRLDKVTDEQIEALRVEAIRVGDVEQSELCVKALDGNAEARRKCAEAIADAEAMID